MRFLFALLLVIAGFACHRNSAESGAAVLLDNRNDQAPGVQAARSPAFSLSRSRFISKIETYHRPADERPAAWIALVRQEGGQFGPWPATPFRSPGAPIRWTCLPETTLPPGTYSVIDSRPETWMHNATSRGEGFTRVVGQSDEEP